MSSTRGAIVRQFGKPSGALGVVAGLVMRLRASNRLRNARTVDLLEIRPEDRVLEVGFGPGLAVARTAGLAEVRAEILQLAPVPAACVLGRRPPE